MRPKKNIPEAPRWLKVTYTLFVLIFIPIYWKILGPQNFLWFSDIALFTTVLSLWLRSRLLNSMMVLSVLLLETCWTIDVGFQAIVGKPLIGLAAYMFDPHEKLVIKILSGFFHIGMPATLVYLLIKWGYDRRALLRQTMLAAIVIPLTYWVHPQENINWVYGLGGKNGATLGLSQPLYLVALIVAFPLLVYTPMHFLLKKIR